MSRKGMGLIVLVAVAVFVGPGSAAATQCSGYSMEILINGVPQAEISARGTTYVEALGGAEYAVRITNHTSRRIAVALAVDGLNSIDARTTSAVNAKKWVLAAHESITVRGWQTSTATARRFFFTTQEQSYAAWLGKTGSLGVIEAVVFREKTQPVADPKYRERPQDARGSRDSRQPAAPQEPEGQLNDDLAATGIGRRVDNQVRYVRFRTENGPAAQLRLRYEFRPQLVRLGVVSPLARATALDRRENARGFTDSDFAPDPGNR